MKIDQASANGRGIAVVTSTQVLISDGQTTLDFIMSIQYETGHHAIVLNKEALSESFFTLSTKVAGDIMQKLVNYKFKLAVIGDFTQYTSKSLNDFIYESNLGKTMYFVSNMDEAIAKLG